MAKFIELHTDKGEKVLFRVDLISSVTMNNTGGCTVENVDGTYDIDESYEYVKSQLMHEKH